MSSNASENAISIDRFASLGVTQLIAGQNILAFGPSGAGKSEVIRSIVRPALAKHHGLDVGDGNGEFKLWDIRLSHYEAPDLRGYPSIENGLSTWNAPDWLPKDGEAGILFIDEIANTTDRGVLFGVYELVQERTLGDYTLPKNVYVCAAANRDIDVAGLEEIPSALRQRFWVQEVKPTLEGWRDHAVNSGIDIRIIAAATAYPELITDWDGEAEGQQPNGRELDRCSKALAIHEEKSGPNSDLRTIFGGYVGYAAASQIANICIQFDAIIPITRILEHPNTCELPEGPDQRASVTCALAVQVKEGTCAAAIQYLTRLDRRDYLALFKSVVLKRNEHGAEAAEAFTDLLAS